MSSLEVKPLRPLFGTVFRHEARLLWRDKGVAALLLLVILWMSAAVFVGKEQQERQIQIGQRLRAADEEFLKTDIAEFAADPQGWRKSPLASSYRLKQSLVLPPGLLATLDVGQSDLRPATYTVVTDWEKFFLVSGPLRNESVLQTGRFDAGFVVVYLLPLVVIALTFNLLAGDREKGTLLLVLSQPVAPRTLLGASVLVRFLVLSAVVLGSALLLTALLGGIDSPQSIARLLLWCLTVVAYLAFWFALAALVVALGSKSSLNALVLAIAWIFLTVGVPGLVSMAAETRYPVPPRSDVMREINLINDRASKNWRTNYMPFRVFYKDFPELMSKTVTLTPTEFRDTARDSIFQGRVRMARQYTVEKAALKAAAPHRAALNNQIALVRRSRLFSPVIAVREGLMDIAGAGDGRYQNFEEQALTFWTKWRYKFFKHQFYDIPITVDDYRQVQWFQYREQSTRDIFSRVFPSIAAMLMLTALLLAASFKFVSRRQSPLAAR